VAYNEERDGSRRTFTGPDDEMGLAEAQAQQTGESIPDTLEVRSDALVIMQDSLESMRPSALLAGVVGGAVALVIVGATLIGWIKGRPTVTAP
jgi:hypothetical protein